MLQFSPTFHTSPRSSSRSPTRQTPFSTRNIDPLLSSLSPTSTLEALSATDAVPDSPQNIQRELRKSISQASPAERALGIRAALAARKFREWHTEITEWEWPDVKGRKEGAGFQPPKPRKSLGAGSRDVIGTTRLYFGSLPADLFEHYEERLDQIRDELEALDVDELKEHVLNITIPSRSRPSSSNIPGPSIPDRMTYTHLRDFTAVVTTTILQSLPVLSKLNALLSTWDVRILVLRQVSGYLDSLQIASDAMRDAWSLLAQPLAEQETDFTWERFRSTKSGLERQVAALGIRMDRMLDALEGRDDALPDAWIDQLETIEHEFGTWTVKADRLVVQTDLVRRRQERSEGQALTENSGLLQEEMKAGSDNGEDSLRPCACLEDQVISLDVQSEARDESTTQCPSEVAPGPASMHIQSEGEPGDTDALVKEAATPSEDSYTTESGKPGPNTLIPETTETINETDYPILPTENEEGQTEVGSDAPQDPSRDFSQYMPESILVKSSLETFGTASQESGTGLGIPSDVLRTDNDHVPNIPGSIDASEPSEGQERIGTITKGSNTGEATLDSKLVNSYPDATSIPSKEKPSMSAPSSNILPVGNDRTGIAPDAPEQLAPKEIRGAADTVSAQLSSQITEVPLAEMPTTDCGISETHSPSPPIPVVLSSRASSELARIPSPEPGQMSMEPENRSTEADAQQEPVDGETVVDAIIGGIKDQMSRDTDPDNEQSPSGAADDDHAVINTAISSYNPQEGTNSQNAKVLHSKDVQSQQPDALNSRSAPDEPFIVRQRSNDVLEIASNVALDEADMLPSSSQRSSVSCATRAQMPDASKQERHADVVDSEQYELDGPPNDLQPTVSSKPSTQLVHSELDRPSSNHVIEGQVSSHCVGMEVLATEQQYDQREPSMPPISEEPLDEKCAEQSENSFDSDSTNEQRHDLNHTTRSRPPNLDRQAFAQSVSEPTLTGSDSSSSDAKTPRSPWLISSSIQSPPDQAIIPSIEYDDEFNQIAPSINENDDPDALKDRSKSRTRKEAEIEKQASLPLERYLRDSTAPNPRLPPKSEHGLPWMRDNSWIKRGQFNRGLPSSVSSETLASNQSHDATVSPVEPASISFTSDRSDRAESQYKTSRDSSLEPRQAPRMAQLKKKASLEPSPLIELAKRRKPPAGDVSSGSPAVPRMTRRPTEQRSFLPRSPAQGMRHVSAPAQTVRASPQPPARNLPSSRKIMHVPRKSIDERMDDRITSILSTVPGRIRLTNNANETIEKKSKIPQSPDVARRRVKSVSMSPGSAVGSVRAVTPAPSITLTPANQSIRSQTQNSDSAIKQYLLQRGENDPPMKLLVRLVGGDGERLMVRVGGGWADLGEYLREYAQHHGHITESRLTVQDLPDEVSPPRSITPGPSRSSGMRSGRTTPMFSRPSSALETRSTTGGSLTVNKVRRQSAAASAAPPNSALVRSSSDYFSLSPGPDIPPIPSIPLHHRTSVTSMAIPSSPPADEADLSGNTPLTTPSLTSTPLGLAGPKPKSRQVSMSEEREKWVSDMLGQARRVSSGPRKMPSSSSLRRVSGGMGVLGDGRSSLGSATGRRVVSARQSTPSEEVGLEESAVGSSTRRVFLRGMGVRGKTPEER